MTEHPRSVETGGVGTTPSVAARQETSGASVMRSPRGFLGSIVLVLSLPVAVLTQVLLSGAFDLVNTTLGVLNVLLICFPESRAYYRNG